MAKCKKAAELKSTSDLKLSKRQWSYLFKKYKDFPGIVYAGRKFAHNPMRELPASQVPLTLYELERQLSLNGYIRSDINDCTFAIGALYKKVYGLECPELFPYSFDCLDNESYETFENPGDESARIRISDAIRKTCMNHYLTPLEYETLIGICPLWPNVHGETYREIAGTFHCTLESVRAAECRAIQKLRQYATLPAIMPPNEDQKCELTEIITKLKKVCEDPIIKERDILVGKLMSMKNRPLDYPDNLKRYFNPQAFDTRDIDCLNLDIMIENRLRAAGIQTISDLALTPDYCLENINHLNEDDTRLIRSILKNLH